jgi:ABC-2 type transport system ATP-binding protein
MAEEPAIQVRGLRKRYGQVVAVEDLDLEVGHGEVVALLGPNGAGKTTTVEILEGYRHRDGGDVAVLGEDPACAPLSWRYGSGIVLQETRDAAELSVAEAVRHFAGYYPEPRDAAEVIEDVGLTSAAGQRLRTLSGGQRRRLDVAIGIVGRPRLLFLDEPTSGFDPQARRNLWATIRDLAAASGTTVLLTTHYLEEAEALADRVAVIQAGRMVAQGAPSTLGGRATGTATVSWCEDSGPRSVTTANPDAFVIELAARLGGRVPGLAVTRQSLEDVYLKLISEDSP